MNSSIFSFLVLFSLICSCSCSRYFRREYPFYGTAGNRGFLNDASQERFGKFNPKEDKWFRSGDNYETLDKFDSMETSDYGLDSIGGGSVFNVLDFGASGSGRTDDSPAFKKAWQAACGSSNQNPTMLVPKGKTFLLSPLDLQGPCKTPIIVQMFGTLVAPGLGAWDRMDTNRWVSFGKINGLTIDGGGSGQFDGQGQNWWNKCNTQDCIRPTALHVTYCNGVLIKALELTNSPMGHISISGCNSLTVSGVSIRAPEDSPNTDGIDVSSSSHVALTGLSIQSGDDCIAINTGSTDVNISNIDCGPGHGISIGSLGRNGESAAVEKIRVWSSVIRETTNGVRIKTWQGGSGYARQISFSDIKLHNVKNPIIIDQFYCGGGSNCKGSSSAVAISDVTYAGINGTSASQDAIVLNCNAMRGGCKNIVLNNVNIAAAISIDSKVATKVTADCSNVQGRMIKVSPSVSCLKPTFY